MKTNPNKEQEMDWLAMQAPEIELWEYPAGVVISKLLNTISESV